MCQQALAKLISSFPRCQVDYELINYRCIYLKCCIALVLAGRDLKQFNTIDLLHNVHVGSHLKMDYDYAIWDWQTAVTAHRPVLLQPICQMYCTGHTT